MLKNIITQKQIDQTLSIKGLNSSHLNTPSYFQGPISMIWELTGKCNLNCLYCSGNFPRKTTELTGSEKLKLADELIESGIFMVNLSGGDPLLCDQLLELVEKFHNADVDIMICTTGMSNNQEELIKNLCDYPDIAFNISIDSQIPEINDFQRGKKAYENARRLIENIRSFKGNHFISVESVVTKKNYDNFENLIDDMIQLNIQELRFQPVVAVNTRVTKHNLALTQEEINELEKRIYDKIEGLKSDYSSSQFIAIRCIDQSKAIIEGLKTSRNWGGTITPEGDLLLSSYIPFIYDNIKNYQNFQLAWDSGFRTAWDDKEVRSVLSNVANITDIGHVFKLYNYEKKILNM